MSPAFPSASAEELAALFPLTSPVPTPLSHPHLIHPSTLATEEDLLAEPTFQRWWDHIHNTRRRLALIQQDELATLGPAADDPTAAVLGPLRTEAARLTLQTVTSFYERALAVFPTSFKLWKSYLLFRHSLVLGPSAVAGSKKEKAGLKSAKRKLDTAELLDEVRRAADWEGGLDGVVGYEEWRALIATGERMVAWLPNVRLSLALVVTLQLADAPPSAP